MQVYMVLVQEDEQDVGAKVQQAISQWFGEGKTGVELIAIESGGPGLQLTPGSKFDLKDPLNALQSIAKQHKCNFVVGTIADDGEREDVCYFGHDEGRPDLHEIGCYLGL